MSRHVNNSNLEKKASAKTASKRRIIKIILSVIFVAISSITCVAILLLSRIDYVLKEEPFFEVNSEAKVVDLFEEINSDSLENPETALDTSIVGENNVTLELKSYLGNTKKIEVPYTVKDSTPPTIHGEAELVLYENAELAISDYYSAADNSLTEVALSIRGDYDLATIGDYNIEIVATDQSGNQTIQPITLKVIEDPEVAKLREIERQKAARLSSRLPYYIKVNRQMNVVMVYGLDQNGEYARLIKTFVSSVGRPDSETPLGVFKTSDRYESLYLVGYVWGHYTVRISGPYFFHSVPYFTQGPPWNNLEYLEYNKLGSPASAGCVRLAAIDAKWIYDNIPYGTTVEIYDSDTLPSGVTKPTPIKISEDSPCRGWDPTDPNPANPWS